MYATITWIAVAEDDGAFKVRGWLQSGREHSLLAAGVSEV